jgi:hypothetical protein
VPDGSSEFIIPDRFYVGVGAPRAGTTWWHSLIRRHPEAVYAQKELKHFANVMPRKVPDAESYARKFNPDAIRLQGEWTPRYMYDPWGMMRLAKVVPHARILAILRDPWDRAVSGFLRAQNDRLASAVWMMNDAIEKSLYARQVERIYEAYPAESVLILQFEKLIDSPEPHLERTYRHLGFEDTSHLPSDYRAKVNASTTTIADLVPEVEIASKREFTKDAERLIELVPDLDLSLWPSIG